MWFRSSRRTHTRGVRRTRGGFGHRNGQPAPKVPRYCVVDVTKTGNLRRRSPAQASSTSPKRATCAEGPPLLRRRRHRNGQGAPKVPRSGVFDVTETGSLVVELLSSSAPAPLAPPREVGFVGDDPSLPGELRVLRPAPWSRSDFGVKGDPILIHGVARSRRAAKGWVLLHTLCGLAPLRDTKGPGPRGSGIAGEHSARAFPPSNGRSGSPSGGWVVAGAVLGVVDVTETGHLRRRSPANASSTSPKRATCGEGPPPTRRRPRPEGPPAPKVPAQASSTSPKRAACAEGPPPTRRRRHPGGQSPPGCAAVRGGLASQVDRGRSKRTSGGRPERSAPSRRGAPEGASSWVLRLSATGRRWRS